jgi:hypothetical protein
MADYAMITSAGMSNAVQATTDGTLIQIKYFVPVYDYRIDPFIDPTDTSYSADDISTVTDPSDTHPFGEILWNTSGSQEYSLNNNAFIVLGGSVTSGSQPWSVNNAPQRVLQPINFIDGGTIGDYISGSSMTPPSGTDTNWLIYDAEAVYGNNITSAIDNSMFFNTVDYTAVQGEENATKASFQCRLSKDIGRAKFNKVALYCVKLDTSYNETGDPPVLFAQAILPETQIKSTKGNGGIDEFIFDVQIELTTSGVDFNNILYATSGDYWHRIPEDGGVKIDTAMYVGRNFTTAEYNYNVAKSIIGTWEVTNNGELSDVESDLPQLSLQYVTGTGDDRETYRTSFQVVSGGDLVISANDIKPSVDATTLIGTSANRFFGSNLYDYLKIGYQYYTDDYSEIDISVRNAYFRNVNVICQEFPDPDTSESPYKDYYFIGNNKGPDGDYYNIGSKGSDNRDSYFIAGIADLYYGEVYKNTIPSLMVSENISNLFSDNGDTTSKMHLLAPDEIYFYKNLVPLIGEISNVGSNSKPLNNVYTHNLIPGTGTENYGVQIYGALYPFSSSDSSSTIGLSTRPWLYGYFSDVEIGNTLVVGSVDSTNANITNIYEGNNAYKMGSWQEFDNIAITNNNNFASTTPVSYGAYRLIDNHVDIMLFVDTEEATGALSNGDLMFDVELSQLTGYEFIINSSNILHTNYRIQHVEDLDANTAFPLNFLVTNFGGSASITLRVSCLDSISTSDSFRGMVFLTYKLT